MGVFFFEVNTAYISVVSNIGKKKIFRNFLEKKFGVGDLGKVHEEVSGRKEAELGGSYMVGECWGRCELSNEHI